jgi:hypothetical protein
MDEKYPELYLEALAYHEAGHLVMATLLGVSIEKVAIGPRCLDPNFNGKVFLPTGTTGIPIMLVVLMEVASEPAEKLAPSFRRFSSLHKVYPHLEPFKVGVRNDLARGFQLVMTNYALMGYSEGTAKRLFKAEYRDPAAVVIGVKADAVHSLAAQLKSELEVSGDLVSDIVRQAGPSPRIALGQRLQAALDFLQPATLDPAAAWRHLRLLGAEDS